jgi:hypothetical protein
MLKTHSKIHLNFLVILLLLLQRPVLATNDTNKLEPNTVAKLFEPNVMYSHQGRIDKIIRILEKESVEESLAQLSDFYLYMWPGWGWTIGKAHKIEIPLPETIGKDKILDILGNRRFLKVIEDLSLLPKEQAESLVNKEITSSLQEYKELFGDFLKENEKFFEKDFKIRQQTHEVIGFPGYIPGGKPTLSAMRYKVLALVLIAGNLQLKQTQPAITKVLETAIEQRNRFYNKNLWHEADSFTVLTMASLYNRQILATGVLGTFIETDKAEEILKKAGCKMASEKLTHFYSPVALYDLSHFLEGKATDYSKGELTIQYLAPLTDSAFDALITAIKAQHQEPVTPEDSNKPANKI